MLSWPSVEVVQTLVLLAWAEFGSGRDSGLWMYSRMAVAMAMDLGTHLFDAQVDWSRADPVRRSPIRSNRSTCYNTDGKRKDQAYMVVMYPY